MLNESVLNIKFIKINQIDAEIRRRHLMLEGPPVYDYEDMIETEATVLDSYSVRKDYRKYKVTIV